MKIFFSLALVIIANTTHCFAEITSSPGIQRLSTGDDCIFRWTISGSVDGYQISNQTTGSPNTLREGASSTYNADSGDIILIIWNVQWSDAGNYWLTTNGQTSHVDSSAWLFIYGSTLTSIYQTSGPNPATEGDTVELSCNATSGSLPAAFRPKMYYFWTINRIGSLQNASSGPAMLTNGSLVFGHSIKNDGRTLVIDSVKYPDDSYFSCIGWEDGSPYKNTLTEYQLSMRYRPYISTTNLNRKITAIVITDVLLFIQWYSWQGPTYRTNWNFTDTAGIPQNLPLNSRAFYTRYTSSLQFNFTSSAYYGKYSMIVTNALGSSTVDFQVLPPGPPETPANLRLFYVSDSAISVNWNIMFSNSMNYLQTAFIRLSSKDLGVEIDVQSLSASTLSTNYNYSYNTVFKKGIQPNCNYEVQVWSINIFGRSGVAVLPVRTRKTPHLIVSPDTISINGSQATINFTLMGDDIENITGVNVTCCSSQTGPCVKSSFQGTAAPNQIVIKDLPHGTDYLFDLTVSRRMNRTEWNGISMENFRDAL